MKIKFKNIEVILWIILYPIIAISFIFIGNDTPFFTLIKTPFFKTDIPFALIITYIVGGYLKWLMQQLDRPILRENFKLRIKHQFFKGVLIPLVFAMISEIIYLRLIQIPLYQSSIFYLEMPLTLLFLIVINFFYIAEYLIQNKKPQIITIVENTIPEIESIKYIMVQKGYSEEKINIENCAFIKSANKILWLYTFDGNYFQLNGTLEEWETKLTPIFFRINRQYIVAQNSVKSIEKTDTRKVKVFFCIPNPDEVFISKVNAACFKKWWKNNRPS
jgi:hypothetical protein